MAISIPQIIAQLSSELRITRQECAKVLGISEATLSSYEQGAVPTSADRMLIEKLVSPLAVVQMLKGKERLLGVKLHERLMRVAVSRVSQGELLESKGKLEHREQMEFLDRLIPRPSGFDK
jgi:transcriptional regulator with XRE-family HTH domain